MVFIAQVFSYKARDKNGALSEGLMEASSIEGVKAKLKEKGYYIIAIKESKSEKSSSIKNLIEKTRGVSTQDLVLFCRQFSTMVSSGLSLVRTLEILGEQTVNSKLKEAINSVADNVESGQSFSQALEEHTDIFPSLFISMMEAGEAGGVLDEVLEKMAIHFERDNDLKQKVTSALVYPIVVTIVAFLTIFFLITFVVPTFVDMFAGLNQDLPAVTRMLIAISDFFGAYWHLILVIVVGVGYGSYWSYNNKDDFKKKMDGYFLKMPLFGDLLTKLSVTHFSKTLAILLRSGVPILDGMDIVSKVISNKVMSDKIKESRDSISEGNSITLPLREGKIFPSMVLQMIKIGEETGNLDAMLDKIGDFYEQEVGYKVEGMVSLIEPALIVFLGLVVGAIVIAIMLPMFDMIQGI